MAQKVRAGDIDFAINATANTATVVPQSGVFSLHFIFRDEAHLEKAMGDRAINDAFRQMIDGEHHRRPLPRPLHPGLPEHVREVRGLERQRHRGQEGAGAGDQDRGRLLQRLPRHPGAHAVRPGLHVAPDRAHPHRGERQRRGAEEQALRSRAVRLQDRARGQQLPHLGQPEDLGRSAARPSASRSSRRPTTRCPTASRKALELSTAAVASLQKVGVKYHEQVDKKSFSVIAAPLQDSQAQELGKHAVQLLALVRGIK